MRRMQVTDESVLARPLPLAQPRGVVGLILLLAVTGSGLAVFAGPPDLDHLPSLPSWETLEVLARSPNPPLDGTLTVAVLAAWLVWAWAAASVAVELALALAERGPARGASWLRRARAVADRITLPLARRAVAAAIVVQIATRPAFPALTFAMDAPALITNGTAAEGGSLTWAAEPTDAQSAAPADGIIHHVVQRGETLWSIAERYYGTGEDFDRVIDANIGKRMPDGRVFDRAGLIYPGWTLDIQLPSLVIEERDGTQWYVVQRGDTLSGIAARLLGDADQYHELFELNAGARLGEDGPSLSSPDLIWPELRLRLPVEVVPPPEPATQPEVAVEAEPAPPTVVATPTSIQTATPTATSAVPAVKTPASGYEVPADDNQVAAATPPAEPIIEPSVSALPTEDVPQVDAAAVLAVVGAAGAIGGLGLAGTRVFRRRRRSTRRDEPSIALDQGFALADPARTLGQRLAGETDAATEVANRLARSFAAVLAASLSESERSEVFGKVALVAVRHGQTSTTCAACRAGSPAAPPGGGGHQCLRGRGRH